MEKIKNKLGIYKYKKIGIAGWILRFGYALRKSWKDIKFHFRGLFSKKETTPYTTNLS